MIEALLASTDVPVKQALLFAGAHNVAATGFAGVGGAGGGFFLQLLDEASVIRKSAIIVFFTLDIDGEELCVRWFFGVLVMMANQKKV